MSIIGWPVIDIFAEEDSAGAKPKIRTSFLYNWILSKLCVIFRDRKIGRISFLRFSEKNTEGIFSHRR